MNETHSGPSRSHRRMERGLMTFAVMALLLLPAALYLHGCGRTTMSGYCPAGSTMCECDVAGDCTWCGNLLCDGQESCTTCPGDCGKCNAACGDGTCDPGETCSSCSADCGKCPDKCGDGKCDKAAGEDCKACPKDCGKCPATCGDGFCDKAGGESCKTCAPDCGKCPPSCGDGKCDPNEECNSCPGDCGKCCGNGACDTLFGEDCKSCPGDCGKCPPPPGCGDGKCQGAESCSSCPKDCGSCCGNGTCDAAYGETCKSCPTDCGACPPTCGNNKCDGKETCQTCPADCGACCGNSKCEASLGETCTTCPKDCGACPPTCGNNKCDGKETCSSCPKDCGLCCGDKKCDASVGETCSTCPTDCGACPPKCGDGTCDPNEDCNKCPSDCGKCCGNNKCEHYYGETCTTCPADCGKCPPKCGDGTCDPNEDCNKCAADCGKCCGNNKCEAAFGETCNSCPGDCGKCCGNGTCDAAYGESCTSCPADCGKCPPKCGDGKCVAADGEDCSKCPTDCGKCCGNGLCDTKFNENCGNCPADCGQCCGNNTCDSALGETCFSCETDCGPCCGNKVCDASYGEDCLTCQGDCGKCCGNKVCDTKYGEDCLSCATDCACGSGQVCSWGSCLSACAGGAPRCPSGSSTCCKPGQVCMTMGCVTPGKVCNNNYDCGKNEFCDPSLKKCLPLPTGPRCLVFPKNVTFKAKEEWSWTGWSKDKGFSNVVVTPVVADLDADGVAEVIFAAYKGNKTSANMLIALDGATGKEDLAIPHTTLNLVSFVGAAVGNLDNDKQLEIVVPALNLGLVVLEHDGKIKWSNKSGQLATIATGKTRPQVALADMNGDGSPEIIAGGVVLSAAGKVLLNGAKLGATGSWIIPTVADLDEDGTMELVGGNRVYNFNGKLAWENNKIPDGFPAVADMDGDGLAEVVTIAKGKAYVLAGATKGGKTGGAIIFGPISVPGGGNGGPPTIGDFDGDGNPEFSTAGTGAYTVYDLDCTAAGTATTCVSGRKDGILWTVKTQDISSNVTGSSLFDFEGDGKVEVVYNDECFLRVYDGKTGKELMKLANTSRTGTENALVADVDGDNNSEFVVPANNDQIKRDKCKAPGTSGIRVFGDSADLWVRSRPVWNQHAYQVTHVDDSGNIPKNAQRNWDTKGLNNFRANVQGQGAFYAPDLKVTSLTAKTFGCPLVLVLRAQVTNAGSLGVAAGLSVSFYVGATLSSAKLIKTVKTTAALLPGQSELLTLQYGVPGGQKGPFNFWVVADDDGTGKGSETECNETNNSFQLKGAKCP